MKFFRFKLKKKFFMGFSKAFFWFLTGVILAIFLLISFTFIVFENLNTNRVYPGITVGNIDLGGKTEQQVADLFEEKNKSIEDVRFTFSDNIDAATISAKELELGYDENLIAKQAIELGRSKNFFSDIYIAFQSYFYGLQLHPAYHYSEETLSEILEPFIEKTDKEPINALFTFQNGKVTAFQASEEGIKVDTDAIREDLVMQMKKMFSGKTSDKITIPVETKIIEPDITTDKVNNLGIKELIGEGTSFFYHSIQSRIFNINLAASRINGALVAPGETFSFDKALGDVSSFTGYKQAYVIQNGKTILGDGGGVCQVSTTFFRALLNAGLPITERHAHAYRVSYYEYGSPPGLDATIYVPTVDLKFKNDTENYILIQTVVNMETQQLSVFLYGTKDGRTVKISNPIVTNRIPPPPDAYQDDPTLPKGEIKQIDFKAEGSTVSFTREVMKDGEKIISEKFVSNYAPWQSVYLRGTKE